MQTRSSESGDLNIYGIAFGSKIGGLNRSITEGDKVLQKEKTGSYGEKRSKGRWRIEVDSDRTRAMERRS
ncbi:hypothetical protein M5689_024941 [Euphorbia peplus]|nr:hypothetical protein M5689_024941 [Euphorbia peplus]